MGARHLPEDGACCSFACVPDKANGTVHVLAAPELGPIHVGVMPHMAQRRIRAAIADHFGIHPNTFGFHQAQGDLLQLINDQDARFLPREF